MDLRLIPQLVTLNGPDAEPVITLKVFDFKANSVKLTEARVDVHCPQQKYSLKFSFWQYMIYGDIHTDYVERVH